MTPTPDDTNAAERRPWWRRAVAFLLLWAYRITGTMVILAALVVVFAQTDIFRKWAKDVALYAANDALMGKVFLDDVRLDILHGITLVHPRVYAADSTLVLDAQEISVTYDLAPLLNNIVAINEIRIVKPQINVQRRAGQQQWNIDRIVKPSTDTTTSEPPNLHFVLRSLRIDGAKIYVNDLNTPWGDGQHFDPMHMSLRDLDMRLSGRFSPRRRDHSVILNHLKFTDNTGILKVNHLSFVARVAPGIVEIPTLRGRLQNTDIALRAQIDSVDLLKDFSMDQLKKHPARVRLECDRVAASDVRYFVPGIDIVDWYSVKGDVTFNGSDITMQGADIRADRMLLQGDVAINNIDGAKPLELDVHLHDSYARYADLRRRIRFVELPELTFLGSTRLEKLHMHGIPSDSLWFDVKVQDNPGAIEGQMMLDFRGKEMGYVADVNIRNGRLQSFMQDSGSLKTNLNAHVKASGKGFDVKTMVAFAEIDLDASSIGGRDVRNGKIVIRTTGDGIVNADTLIVNVTPYKRDSADNFMDIGERQMLSLSGSLDMRDERYPRYKAHVVSEALDLARLLESPSMPTRFTADMDVDMQGFELDSLFGTVNGNIGELSLLDRTILPFPFSVKSERLPDNQRNIELSMKSVDARITGRFLPSGLIDASAAAGTTITEVINDRIHHIVNNQGSIQPIATPLAELDATMDIQVHDAGLVNVFTSPTMILAGSLRLQGRIVTRADAVDLTIDTLRVSDMSFERDSLQLTSDPAEMSARVQLANLLVAPRVEQLALALKVDSVLYFNDMKIRNPDVMFSLKNDVGEFGISAGIDGMAAGARGTIEFRQDAAVIRFDSSSFELDTARELTWHTMEPSIVEIRNGEYTFTNFRIQRQASEFFTLNGTASLEEFKNFTVDASQFNLVDVGRFAELGEESPVLLLDGILSSAHISINGSWKEPVIEADISATELAYNYEHIGSMQLKLSHRNRNVVGSALISNPKLKGDTNTLVLNIAALPMDLAFASVEQRLVDGQPIDVQLKATNLSLAAAEPFLPAIEHVRGLINASINIKGTTGQDMAFTGEAAYKNARFTVSATNVEYRSDARLRLEGSKLIFDTLTLRNLETDYPGGYAFVNGEVNFDGMNVKGIDFTVRSPRLEIMTLASQATSPNVYGNLVIATNDSRPLHFYGPLDAPVLQGDIRVLYGDLVWPEERSSTKKRISTFQILNNDSTRREVNSVFDFAIPSTVRLPIVDTAAERVAMADSLRRDSVHQDSLNNDSAPARSNYVQLEPTPAVGSFVDNMLFNLNIYFEGSTLIQMNLGPMQTLTADIGLPNIQEPLQFNGRMIDNSIDLRGKLLVKEGSTLKFFRPFTASGTIDFNTGGLTNPGLNLVASYKDTRFLADNRREDFRVQINITGTKNNPLARFSVYRNDVEQRGDPGKIQGDALSLILLGKTSDEITKSGGGGTNLGSQLNGSLSAVASSAFNELLSDIAFIQSAEVSIGNDLNDSRINLSGQLVGNISYRFSGNVSDISGNSTFTVSIPMSELGDGDALRYFALDIARSINQTGNITRQQKNWEVKLGARLP